MHFPGLHKQWHLSEVRFEYLPGRFRWNKFQWPLCCTGSRNQWSQLRLCACFFTAPFGISRGFNKENTPKTKKCRVYNLKTHPACPSYAPTAFWCTLQLLNNLYLYMTYRPTSMSPSCEVFEKTCRTSSEQLRKITRCCMMLRHATSTSASSHHNLYFNCLQET